MRVGLYLQDKTMDNDSAEKLFWEKLREVNKAKLDLLVFPEHAWTPYGEQLFSLPVSYDNEDLAYEDIKDIIKEISQTAGCPIIFCQSDYRGAIYSIYINPKAQEYETKDKLYLKHVATEFSMFDLTNYIDNMEALYDPIILKGFRIGITVCYDSTFPMISRAYGVNGVDLIVNSTGGHVDYKKWSYYQKVRALENDCSTVCTMAYYDKKRRNKSYVFGYNQYGEKLHYTNLKNRNVFNLSTPNEVYITVINHSSQKKEWSNRGEYDEFYNQKPRKNKYDSISIDPNLLKRNKYGKKIKSNVYCLNYKKDNVIFLYINGKKIFSPEIISDLFYCDEIKTINNKKYIIVNKWGNVNVDFFNKFISSTIKVRAAENFCAVIFLSRDETQCIQVGKNKNIQIVAIEKNLLGIDLSRTSGPEALWKNKANLGMKAHWRENYKRLIDWINNKLENVYQEDDR